MEVIITAKERLNLESDVSGVHMSLLRLHYVNMQKETNEHHEWMMITFIFMQFYSVELVIYAEIKSSVGLHLNSICSQLWLVTFSVFLSIL